MKLIDKDSLVAEIERRKKYYENIQIIKPVYESNIEDFSELLSFIDTLEVTEVDSIIHTIIAECCDWLAMNTNLSHNEIEGCRNLMLTVKEEQFKIQKGEEV